VPYDDVCIRFIRFLCTAHGVSSIATWPGACWSLTGLDMFVYEGVEFRNIEMVPAPKFYKHILQVVEIVQSTL